jgi:hypothetical protein
MTENNTQMPIPAIKDQLPLNDERPELFRLNALPMTMHFTPGYSCNFSNT